MIKTKCDACGLDLGVVMETDLFICETCCYPFTFMHESELENFIYKVKTNKHIKTIT